MDLTRFEDALAEFDRACEVAPDSALAHYCRARTLALLQRKTEMLAALDRTIELDPDLRESAQAEEDFAGYLTDPEFRGLVGLDASGDADAATSTAPADGD